MKRRSVLLFVLITGILSQAYPQTQSRLVVFPAIHNLSAGKDAEKTEKYALMIWKSLYNFLNIVPMLEVPNADEISGLEWQTESIPQIASNYQAAFVISGGTFLSNNRLVVNIALWDNVKNSTVLNKTYITGTDYELLDTLDRIIDDTVGAILNTPIKTAVLNFTDIKISDKTLEILLNGKTVANVGKSGYSEKMKVLAGNTYHIEFVLSGGKSAYTLDVIPKPDETVNIHYAALPDPSKMIGGLWYYSAVSANKAVPPDAYRFNPDFSWESGSETKGKFKPKSKGNWAMDADNKTLSFGGGEWGFTFGSETALVLSNSSGAVLYLAKQPSSVQQAKSVLALPFGYTTDDKIMKKPPQEAKIIRDFLDIYFGGLNGILYESTFIGLDQPGDKKALQELALSKGAQYLVYGELAMKKDVLGGTVHVWSSQKNKEVYSEKFTVKDGADLLKKIDAVCGNICSKGFGLKPALGTLTFNIPKGIYSIKISEKLIYNADYEALQIKLMLPAGAVYKIIARNKSLKQFYKENISLTNGKSYTIAAAAPKPNIQIYEKAFQNIWGVCEKGGNPYRSEVFLKFGKDGVVDAGKISAGEFKSLDAGKWEVIDETRVMITGIDPKKTKGTAFDKAWIFKFTSKNDDYYLTMSDKNMNDVATLGLVADMELVVNPEAVKALMKNFAGVWGASDSVKGKTFQKYYRFTADGIFEAGAFEKGKFKKQKSGKWKILDNSTLTWTINNMESVLSYDISPNGVIRVKGEGILLYLNPVK
ncbi:MAG: hypothetical protein HPY53_12880 [Brevinematales bacterium]|nr:hypothetical protein [Brevinematales bacterium]